MSDADTEEENLSVPEEKEAVSRGSQSSSGHIVRLVIRRHYDKLPIFLPPSLDFGSNDKSHGSL